MFDIQKKNGVEMKTRIGVRICKMPTECGLSSVFKQFKPGFKFQDRN